jgi:hypothetical protein
MTREGYDKALGQIDLTREAALATCEAMKGPQREVCRAEANAEQLLRSADVEVAYRRTEQATRAAQRARIDARYQVEHAKCGTLAGFARDKCFIRAHATKGRALLEAQAPYQARVPGARRLAQRS